MQSIADSLPKVAEGAPLMLPSKMTEVGLVQLDCSRDMILYLMLNMRCLGSNWWGGVSLSLFSFSYSFPFFFFYFFTFLLFFFFFPRIPPIEFRSSACRVG